MKQRLLEYIVIEAAELLIKLACKQGREADTRTLKRLLIEWRPV